MKCCVYHPIPYNWPSLFIGRPTVTTMNHCYYYFDGPWKVKVLYVIIMSRAHFTFQNTLYSSLNVKDTFLETGAISEV